MKNSEEAIEKVMAGLRNSEPPAGMELRILAAVKHRESTQSATSRFRDNAPRLLTRLNQQKGWRTALAATAVGVILAAFGIMSLHQHRKPATLSELHPNTSAVSSTVQTKEHTRLSQPSTVTPTRATSSNHASHLVAAEFTIRSHRTRNISHPAPEAPLTPQEKLLVQIAQSGNPHALSMLNSEIRVRREAEEDAEFQRFADRSVASPDGDSK
ncbi:hypothetical protein [Acidicapsa acidisoli]|uniref:hypothetical protein n=1 Tax=Acidicapsa acidisoli TaxID=1615681 RepID=UPI0021E00D81|nr:hypothetical protein [Acidicapsa acidisoli]